MSHDGLPIMLAVRLVDIDFDSTVPEPEVDPTRSPLTGKRLQRVPVIRVFGATPRGQKTCLHVHGVFRYFFVPYPGDPCGEDDLQQYLKTLAEELDDELAANAALVGKDGKGRGDEGSNGERRGGDAAWVYDMTIVRLTPFYGYHEEARPFIRVAMVLPHAVDKAAKLFARGFRARLPLQPHEAHIPYLLQFKVDHNLLGMEFVQLAHASWRGLLPATTAATPLGVASPHGSWTAHPGFRNVWKRGTTGGLDTNSPLPRVASTELEADCDRQHILNPRDVLYEPIRSARRDVRLVQSLNQIWADEEQRRRANGMPALSAEAATPASEVARRTRLPPPPPEVERELEVLEANLGQPLPVPTRTAPPEQRRPTPLWSLAAEGPARGGALLSIPGDNPTSHANMEGAAGCGDAANTASASIGDSEGRSDGTVGSLGDLLALEEQGAVFESRSRADAAQSSQLGQQSPHSGPSLGSLLSEMCSKRPGEEMDVEIYRSGGASQAESHQDASSYSQVTSEHRRPQGEANEGEFSGLSRASTSVDDYAATSLQPQLGSSQPCAQGLEHGDAPEDDDVDGEQEECHTHAEYTQFAAPQGDPADCALLAHSYASQAWRREAAECVERHVRAVVGVHGVSVSEHTGTVMVEAISTSMNNTSQIVHSIRRVIQGIGLLVEEAVEDLEGDIAASQALIEHELSGGRNDDERKDARDEITACELEQEGGAVSYSDDDDSAARLIGSDQQHGVRDVEANLMYEEWVENTAHSRERLRRAMSTPPFAEPTTTGPDVAVADEESLFAARSRDAIHAQEDASTHGEESRLAERKRLYGDSLAFSKRAKPEAAAAQVNAGLPGGEDSQPYVGLRQAGMTNGNLESSFEYGDGAIIGGCNVCRGAPEDICTSQVNDAVIAHGSTQSSNQEQFGKSPCGAVAPSASVRKTDRPAKVVESPSATCTPEPDDNPPSPRVPSPKYDNFQDMHKTRVRQGDDRHESDEDGEVDFAMPTTEQPHYGITTSSHSLAAASISDSFVDVLVPWVKGSTPGAHVWTPRLAPPTRLTAAAEVNPRVRHQEPFFSSKRDLPKGGVRVAHNRIFRFEVPELEGLCTFNCASGPGLGCSCSRLQLRPPIRVAHRVLTPVLQPPSVSQVAAWVTKYAPHRLQQEDPSRERQAPVGVNWEADQPMSATQQNAKTVCVVQPCAISVSASAAGTNGASGELAAQVECLATAAATVVGQSPSNKKGNETIHPRSKNLKTIGGQNFGVTQISAPTATHNSAPYLSGDTAELHSCQSLTIMCFEVHVRTKGSMMPNMGQARATDDADMGGLPDLHVAVTRDPAVSATHRNAQPELPNGAASGDELLCIAYAVQHDLPACGGFESESPGKKKTSSSSTSGKESSAVGGVRYGLILRTDHETEAHGAQEGARLRSFLASIDGFQVADDEVTLVRSEAALLQAFAKVVHRHDVDLVLSWDARRRSIGMLIERADNIGIDPPLLRQLGRTPNMTHRNEKFEDLWGERVQSGIHIVGRLVVNVWRCAQQELPLCSYTLENVAHRLLQERVPAYSHETLTRWWDHGLSPSHSNRDGGKHRVLQYYLQRVRLCLRVADAMEVVPRTSELARVFGLDFMSVLTRGSQYRVESMLCRLARAQGFVIPSPDKSQVASQPALQCLPLIMEPEGRFYTSPVIVLDFRSLYPSVIIAYNYCYSTCLGRISNLNRKLDPNDDGRGAHRFGRETLSRTIHMVNNHPTWGARVVYGDTDSLFVLLEGRSRQEAFETGKKIAAAATAANPHPMELELEKVYHPCVLCTKKRYAGFMYEHVGSLPKLDCKGIETVRRDGCPAERKVLERCLRLLFTTCDISLVKSYLLRQCDKILAGRVSEQDFIFATEVKLGHYASDATAPPAAQVAMHRQKLDPNDVVQVGERVPYVVVNMLDSPIYKLRESAQRPEHLLFPRNSRLELNAFYYIIKRILPAVDRVFSLIGVDVFHWYKLELKRTRRNPLDRVLPGVDRGQRGTILGHFESDHCVLCDERCKGLLCGECYRDRGRAFCALSIRQQKLEMRLDSVIQTCMRCCSAYERQVECISLDCPRLFTRLKLKRQLHAASCHIEEATNLLDF
ncbi:hypothetical protein AB1Y20_015514 [Prymnesium parvum]|uniref:DNA polymerase zeta catalytic subunit n=1 Tax=Prymnesium parvum TaxID=97485 RepID=A0AB34K0G3_PRYPA